MLLSESFKLVTVLITDSFHSFPSEWGPQKTLVFAVTEEAFETATEEVPLQKVVSLPAYLKATAQGNHV